MHRAGTISWQIREGIDKHLAMALYIRDAAGLDPYVVTEPDVGALHPTVLSQPTDQTGASVDATLDLRAAVQQWPTWWARALQQVPATTVEEAQEAAPPSPPEWHGVHDLPAVRALVQRHHRDFWSWLDTADQGELDRYRGQRGSGDPLHLTRFVNAHEHQLKRPARPFTLHLRLLPLQQPVGWVLDEQQVVLSTGLREDARALEQLLAPVIAGLA
ncbi:hypothetical protein ACFQ46_22620 [Kineococcus sp. GCM10028916]|uniref:hypothetical protein n=1 Tax=Kineococcus sp. GCM10028916 TaxID=3273394 RepID=UPI0036405A94